MAMKLAATSTEYVRVTAVSKAAGSVITPAAPPRFAFLPVSISSNPVTEDWTDGEWSAPWARIMVGPSGGAITLDPGEYHVWLTWTAGTETPVYRTGGTLTVY